MEDSENKENNLENKNVVSSLIISDMRKVSLYLDQPEQLYLTVLTVLYTQGFEN